MRNLKLTGVAVAMLLMIGSAASAKDVKWASLNPAFKDAKAVNDSSACYACHDVKEHFEKTVHSKAAKNGKKSKVAGVACESCHGPRSLHIENPNRDLALTPAQQSEVCLQCHQDSARLNWAGGKHSSNKVSCVSCHTVMKKTSAKSLLSKEKEYDVCYTCHTDVRGKMNKTSHHPVREGKVSCSDCHNPHGSKTAAMIKGASVNETCFTCHQEKRGPFVWVHPPVIENCLTCHDSHGSNNRKLLNGKDSFVCLTCHSYGGHVNSERYNRVSTSTGDGCVNCHMTIHGSNSPSGAKLTR